MESKDHPKVVILWTHPRAMSTVFERTLLEREDCVIFHEPFTSAFYFGPSQERRSERYKNDPEVGEYNYATIIEHLLSGGTEFEFVRDVRGEGGELRFVYAKCMAYCVMDEEGNLFPEAAPLFDSSLPITHTFLARTPFKSVPSLHVLSVDESEEGVGWDHFDQREVGIKSLLHLSTFIRSDHIQENIHVINADDLRRDPMGAIRGFCEAGGVEFDEGMLSWEDKEIPEWAMWKV